MANVSSNQSWWDSEMANELRTLFYQQYGLQKNALNFLQGTAMNMVKNPTGFSPAALAAMRTGATDTTARQFTNAQQALNARELSTGGADLPSGVNAQLNAGLAAQDAAANASQQEQITLANEEERQQNYWRGINELNGVAAERNPGGYIGDALNASAGVGGLADAATKANESGFGSQLGGAIANSFGKAVGSAGSALLFG